MNPYPFTCKGWAGRQKSIIGNVSMIMVLGWKLIKTFLFNFVLDVQH